MRVFLRASQLNNIPKPTVCLRFLYIYCEMNCVCGEPLSPGKKISTKLNTCRLHVNYVCENLLDKFRQEYRTVFWTLAEQILMKEYVSEQTDLNGMWVRGHKHDLSDVIFSKYQ